MNLPTLNEYMLSYFTYDLGILIFSILMIFTIKIFYLNFRLPILFEKIIMMFEKTDNNEILKVSKREDTICNKTEQPRYIYTKDDLMPFNELKKELDFILSNSIKSTIAKDRINDLLKTFEIRFKKNISIIKSLTINTDEINLAKTENIKIINSLKELISTTKIKKEDFNIDGDLKHIKEYLSLLNKTSIQTF